MKMLRIRELARRTQRFGELLLLGSGWVVFPVEGHAKPSGDNPVAVFSSAFEEDTPGELPPGWKLEAPNSKLAPHFEIVQYSGRAVLRARGNGRSECFGYLQRAIELPANGTFRFRVRFHCEGLEDVNLHVVHGIFAPQQDFNEGIFSYRLDGPDIVGERVFTGPEKAVTAELRLYFRFSEQGEISWQEITIEPTATIPPREVTVAVASGWGDMDHWSQWLDAAGKRNVDIAVLPEFFNVTRARAADVNPAETIDGPAATLLKTKAKQWKMYVTGTFLLDRDGIHFNSAPLYDRSGGLVGIYDKNLLFDPELDKGTTPGVGYPVFDTDFGRVGIMICYDSWYPEPARLMAYKGAELILFPSAGYYRQLMFARSADNGVAIAASSANCPAGIWDSGANAVGESEPEETRFAPTNIVSSERVDEFNMLIATLDLSRTPSPHWWGGPMLSAPGGRRVRQTLRVPIEEEIAREARRWLEPAEQEARDPEPTARAVTGQ